MSDGRDDLSHQIDRDLHRVAVGIGAGLVFVGAAMWAGLDWLINRHRKP